MNFAPARSRRALPVVVFVLGCATSLAAHAQTPARNPLRDAYLGETHLHTSSSFDAYIFGNHITAPADAYKYAKGKQSSTPRIRHQD